MTTVPELLQALVAALSQALGGLTNAPASAPAAASVDGTGWCLAITTSGNLEGELAVWIADADALALARVLRGATPEPDAAAIGDVVRDLCQRAIGQVASVPAFASVTLRPGALQPGQPAADASGFALQAGEVRLTVNLSGSGVSRQPAAPAASRSAAPSHDRLDMVLDIELPLTVRFARTSMPLKALAALGPGAIVNMGRTPDDPVQMLVGDRVIARGEVVVVAGNYGIRITDLVSPADRVRALEG
ncbi:MAG: FliM/FliN family flagellar motor switch protein [Acidobacteria bacterium]|nr:FliM/FliN family flagellar motor switch protein [Acidobacteriota bacterium]